MSISSVADGYMMASFVIIPVWQSVNRRIITVPEMATWTPINRGRHFTTLLPIVEFGYPEPYLCHDICHYTCADIVSHVLSLSTSTLPLRCENCRRGRLTPPPSCWACSLVGSNSRVGIAAAVRGTPFLTVGCSGRLRNQTATRGGW